MAGVPPPDECILSEDSGHSQSHLNNTDFHPSTLFSTDPKQQQRLRHSIMNTAVLPLVVHDFNLILFSFFFLSIFPCENQMMNEDMVEKKKKHCRMV